MLRRMGLPWLVLWTVGMAADGCASSEVAGNGRDDDGDGRVDCFDDDLWVPGGGCPEECRSAFDEDGDGVSGCGDPDCWGPQGDCPERCDVELDEDGDGLVACDDPDCWVAGGECEERCDVEGDQDGDGSASCDDEDCWTVGAGCPERCDAPGDEDVDGVEGCDDDDCLDDPACAPTFTMDVQPIFLTYCAGECHTNDNADAGGYGGFSVERYADVLAEAVTGFCRPPTTEMVLTKGACALFRVDDPPQNVVPMPLSGASLPPDDVDRIRRWVAAGMPL